MISVITVDDKINELKKPWSPIVITRINDQVIRLAMFKGTYPMHKHDKEDELFYVLRGTITIEIEETNQKLVLNQGDLAVVPKGTKHSPISEGESYVLMFEPSALKSSGD